MDSDVLTYVNLTLMYCTLFTVVVSVAMYLLFRGLRMKVDVDLLRTARFRTPRYLTVLLAFKFLSGWIHASLLTAPLKLFLLTVLQTAVLSSIVGCRRLFRCQSMLALIIMEHTFRLLQHILLILDLSFGSNEQLEVALSNCTMVCMSVLIGFSALQIIVDYVGGASKLFACRKKPV